jgi:uncharacterized delta-60 repeat protein
MVLGTLFLLTAASAVGAQSGGLDSTFHPGTGVNQSVYSIAVQGDGNVLIAGDFSSFNSVPRTNIARLTSTGSLDTSFDPGATIGGSFTYLNAVATEFNGEVLLGGSFTGPASTNLARLNTNGTSDAAFMCESDDTINAVIVQTNGAMLLGGFFTEVDGSARSAVAQLSGDGVLDLAFKPVLAGELFSSVFALTLQKDGKIIVGGSFTNVSGTTTTNLARLNTDGTPDTSFKKVSFGSGQLSSAIYATAVDGQGRILAGGDFGTVNGLVRSNLVRFTRDGTVDTTFGAIAGTDSAVNAIQTQTDGKVLIGGYFTVVNGISRNYIARLNADGSLDSSFDPGTGPDAVVYSLALQQDGKVLVGGAFTHFAGAVRGGIARLQNTISLPAPEVFDVGLKNAVFGVSIFTVSGRNYALQFKDSLSDNAWRALAPVAGTGDVVTLSDPNATAPQRFYRVQVE